MIFLIRMGLLDDLKPPRPQRPYQIARRDCGVTVFAVLTGISKDKVRQDLPEARLGKLTVDEWIRWLREKGLSVLRRDGCPADIVPCAHLVASDNPRDYEDTHWVYRDSEGDVYDPSKVYAFWPANDSRIRDLSIYGQKIVTLSVSEDSEDSE